MHNVCIEIDSQLQKDENGYHRGLVPKKIVQESIKAVSNSASVKENASEQALVLLTMIIFVQ